MQVEREQGPFAGRELAAAVHRVLLHLRLARLPGVDPELEAAALCDQDLAAAADARRLAAPVESRLDAPGEPDRALDPLDAPRELDPGQQPAVLQRQGLGDADDAALGAVGRLEHVRPPHVAPRRLELALGRQREATAALRVEQRRERRRRVQLRQRHEVDGAVASDERDRPPVPERRVVADRRVAVLPPHPELMPRGGRP